MTMTCASFASTSARATARSTIQTKGTRSGVWRRRCATRGTNARTNAIRFRALDTRSERSSALVRARASVDDDAKPSEYGLDHLTGEPLEEKGQMTAIITGVVSVALALGYLALVQVFDSRDMLPPPPEALGDGSAVMENGR